VLRFLGDVVNDAGFQDLMRMTTADGMPLRFGFDGRYTNVIADASEVPEPSGAALVLAGLGLLATMGRRRRQSA